MSHNTCSSVMNGPFPGSEAVLGLDRENIDWSLEAEIVRRLLREGGNKVVSSAHCYAHGKPTARTQLLILDEPIRLNAR